MKVTLLTQENCAFCEQAKEMLDRLSAEHEFSVSILDLSSPEGQALAERGGIMFPPGIFIDSEPFSYGRPSERKLRRELAQKTEGPQDAHRDGLGQPFDDRADQGLAIDHRRKGLDR